MKGRKIASLCSICFHLLSFIFLLLAIAGPWTFSTGSFDISVNLFNEHKSCSWETYRSWVDVYCKYDGNGCDLLFNFSSICKPTTNWRTSCSKLQKSASKDACTNMGITSDVTLALMVLAVTLTLFSLPLYLSTRSSEKGSVCVCLEFLLLFGTFLATLAIIFFAAQFPVQQNEECEADGSSCKGLIGKKSVQESHFGVIITISETWGPFFWIFALLALPCLLITAIVRCIVVFHFHSGSYERIG